MLAHPELNLAVKDQEQLAGSRRVRFAGVSLAAQMTGFGAVLAFEVADAPTADRLCDALHLIVHATSLGGVESTIERRSKLPGQDFEDDPTEPISTATTRMPMHTDRTPCQPRSASR